MCNEDLRETSITFPYHILDIVRELIDEFCNTSLAVVAPRSGMS
jgi:hypothetical protein